MTRLRFGLAAATLALVAAPGATAQIGGASAIFLQIEPDSRAAGMGNAGAALADNANATFWNPAGLGFQRGAEVGLTHSTWLPAFDAGLYYEYFVGKYHLGNAGTLGGHVTYFNLGKFTPTDENGEELPIGEIRSYEVAAGLSYGKQLSDNLSVGGGARYIYSDLASINDAGSSTSFKPGNAFAVDLGALYRTDPIRFGENGNARLRAGLNLANFGSTISYSDAAGSENPIPTTLRLGLGSSVELDEFNQVNLAVDFTKQLYHVETDSATGQRTVDSPFKALVSGWQTLDVKLNPNDPDFTRVNALQQLTVGAGAEYWYNQLFAMRVGGFYENPYNGNRKFLTLGAGLRYNIVGADFSYIYGFGEDSPLDKTLRFSLLLAFNR